MRNERIEHQEKIMLEMSKLSDEEKAEMRQIVGNKIEGGNPLTGSLLSKAHSLKIVYQSSGRLKPIAYNILFGNIGDQPLILKKY